MVPYNRSFPLRVPFLCCIALGFFSIVTACATAVRESAPGPSLPGLKVYDASAAVGPVSQDERRSLRVFLMTGDLPEDVVLRLQSCLRTEEGTGPLSPWPSSFDTGATAEVERLRSAGYTHLIRAAREGSGLNLRVVALEQKDQREVSSLSLSFMDRGRREDAGFDFVSASGTALRTRELPAPPLTEESRQQWSGTIKNLGMGVLKLYSASVAQVFVEDGNRLISSGLTPVDLRLRSGERALVLRRQGQPDQRLRFQIVEGQEKGALVHWADDTDPGSIMVFTAPEGLRLALNGDVVGDSPVARSGLLQGDYELEVAKAEKEQSQVLVTDQVRVQSSLRSDRFYPFNYYIQPVGDRLRQALEGGLWAYSAPEQSFVITDFDQVVLPESSGLVSAPIGAKDLQGEVLLGPQSGALGFYGEKDRFLIFPGEAEIRARIEQGGNLSSYMAPRSKQPQTYIYFEIDPERKNLLLRADGVTVYDGPFDAGSTGRIVCLGIQGGGHLPSELLLRSGSEKKGPFYRWSRSAWPPSRLQKEEK